MSKREKEKELLTQSLHRVTFVSIDQKNRLREQEDLIEIATREIVALQKAQKDQQARIAQVVQEGYIKLEEIKALRKET